MKYLALILISMLFGCSSLDAEQPNVKAYIGDLDWVKLYPRTVIPVAGSNRITISNSCGKLDAQYKLESGQLINVWMRMGEWCRNPFDIRFDEQLLIVSQDREIIEYYAIERDHNKKRVVLLERDGWEVRTSSLIEYARNLEKPMHLFSVENGIDVKTQYDSKNTELFESSGQQVFIKKAIYIEDIDSVFGL